MKNKIDGYSLAKTMRIKRREYNLSATAQALFYELVAVNNEYKWADVFRIKNMELCSALSISEKTLKISRDQLIESGLLFYDCGKSKKTVSDYSFKKEFNYRKISGTSGGSSDTKKVPTTPVSTPLSTVKFTVDVDEKLPTVYKQQTKTKTKTKLLAGASAPVGNNSVLYWKEIVDTWFTFYKKNYEVEPTFNGQASKNLKLIVERLKKLSAQSSPEQIWNAEYAIRIFTQFIKKAYMETWLQNNFLLSNLYSKFDSIVATKNSANGNKQPTGASVSTESMLGKINGMSD